MDFSTLEPLVLAGGAIALVIIVALGLASFSRRRAGKRDRLDAAFHRARYARRTGTMGSDRGYIR